MAGASAPGTSHVPARIDPLARRQPSRHPSVPAAPQSEGGPNMGERRRRSRVEPTDDWEQLQILCAWPEQPAYEEIRPLTLFGSPVPGRTRETGVGERELRGSGA